MKTSIMKKSLLDYAIKGKLTSKFRRENPHLSAYDEIHAYNAQIRESKKAKQKELATLEKDLKEKSPTSSLRDLPKASRGNLKSPLPYGGGLGVGKIDKQTIKSQIQALKKEIAKLKEIEILNAPHCHTEALAEVSQQNNAESFPFEIPPSWAWVKLGDICEIILGKTPPREIRKYWDNPKYKWISISDMQERSIIESTKESISEIARQECFKGNIFKKATLIVSFKLSIGKTSFLGFDGFHNEGIASIIPKIHKENDKFFKKFLLEFLPYFTNLCETTGAIKGETLNKEKLENLLIPLPPLVEQKFIADILDTIMVLVNKYESTLESLNNLKY